MAIRKLFKGHYRALDDVDTTVNKNVLRYLKQSHIEKKVSYFLLVFCCFRPVCYWEVIFTGIIQIGLEPSDQLELSVSIKVRKTHQMKIFF